MSNLEARLQSYEAKEKEKSNASSKLQQSPYAEESSASAAKGSVVSTRETSTVSPNERDLFGLGYRSNAILSIGAYGELKFGGHEAAGGWRNGFDAQRIVLLPTLQITDSIIFNAELESASGLARSKSNKRGSTSSSTITSTGAHPE